MGRAAGRVGLEVERGQERRREPPEVRETAGHTRERVAAREPGVGLPYPLQDGVLRDEIGDVGPEVLDRPRRRGLPPGRPLGHECDDVAERLDGRLVRAAAVLCLLVERPLGPAVGAGDKLPVLTTWSTVSAWASWRKQTMAA